MHRRAAAADRFPAPPVRDDAEERSLWLKSCLILEECAKGVKPFVGEVMQRLHNRVIENVKSDVVRDLGACEDAEWDCSACDDADDVKFTENAPVALTILTMDSNGIADCGLPHYLKPHALQPCRLKNIPPGFFPECDGVSPALPLLMCPNPADDNPRSSTFLLLHGPQPPPNENHLTPFLVTRCEPSAPALHFHAVFCESRPGHTAPLVQSFLSRGDPPSARGVFSFAFWSLQFHQAEFTEVKHGVKSGHILRFDGKFDGELPPGIQPGSRYLVTDAKPFSFNICGPILTPIYPLTADSYPAVGTPFVVIRRSPIGRMRDAARLFHSRAMSEVHWSGIRADRLSSHHGEFCKLYCSQTSRQFDFFSGGAESGGEQLFNMIANCTAFSCDKDRSRRDFCSLFNVDRDNLDTIGKALGTLQKAAKSTRQSRNSLSHYCLATEPSVFDEIWRSARQLLDSVQIVASCATGVGGLICDDLQRALVEIDGCVRRDIRVATSNADNHQRADQYQLLEEMDISKSSSQAPSVLMQLVDEFIPDDCKKLGLILKDISTLEILHAVVKSGINDSKLEVLSKMPPQMLQQLYGLPPSKADDFIAKCHLMSTTDVDPDHESWCKACLIMRSCGQGVRPFVARVMQKLHERVVIEIKDSILCYKDECDDSEWTFPEDGKKDNPGDGKKDNNPDFDARPVELHIVAFDPQGAAVSHVPHGLGPKVEPFLISKHSSAGVFQNADLARGSSFVMQSFPQDASSALQSERRFKMSQVQSWSDHFLNLFQVRRESDGACFLAVYCRCRVGQAPGIVNNHFSLKDLKMPAVGSHADSSETECCFWTIRAIYIAQPAKYIADDHNLCSGDCVTFSDICARDSRYPFSLPHGIAPGGKFVVVNLKESKKSFDICVTLVPFENKAQKRLFISRPPFPSGLFREAVYRYHTKGEDCKMSDRWKGVRVRDVPTDYGEFAKFFCSTTQKKLRIFDPDEDRSPELLYNMIEYCRAFQDDIFIGLFWPRDALSDEQRISIRDHLQKISTSAKGVGECRNTSCHGNFHHLDHPSFEVLENHSDNLLSNIRSLVQVLQAIEYNCKWDCVIDAATAQHQVIFADDPSANPPRVCILNRTVLSVFLSQNEQMQLNAMISQFEIERRQKTEEIQKLALRIQSLEERAAMIKNKIRINHLPVIMKSSFDSQISGLQPFAKGGQGSLHKIEHRGQKLVVKLYNGQSNGAWRRELNTLTALLHPNIVEVRRIIYENFSSSKERDLQEPIGYAMECMDRSAGDGIQCSVEQLLGIFEQIADALQFAHERGVIHFDVKPENILLNSECTVAKLCDFGWAHKVKSASASESANSATASSEQGIGRRGTVYYMAPECFSSAASAATALSSAPLSAPTAVVAAGFLSPASLTEPGNVEKSPLPKLCDIYSFGKTMWKLLHPHLDVVPTRAFPVTAQVPANLKKLVEQCTEKEPSLRPQEMSEVLQRLRLIKSDFPGAVAENL